MGRYRKNKFEEASIRFEAGTEFELNQVKIPFWVNVTYKVPISEDKKFYGITTDLIKKDISEKDEIIKAYQKEGCKEIKVEERTIPFSNLCPNCNRYGIPKVEPKNNKTDYHYRVKTDSHQTETKRQDEWWLCYDHEIKPKKCRVAKWDKNHFLFKKKGKAYTELLKYTIPYYIAWQKNGTVIA